MLRSGMLVHSVYFWFKPGTDAERIEGFKTGLQSLCGIFQVKQGFYGKPEDTPPREVIDSSYDWALVAVFDSLADHDAYQDDQVHHDFLAEYSSEWEKVQVYDFKV